MRQSDFVAVNMEHPVKSVAIDDGAGRVGATTIMIGERAADWLRNPSI